MHTLPSDPPNATPAQALQQPEGIQGQGCLRPYSSLPAGQLQSSRLQQAYPPLGMRGAKPSLGADSAGWCRGMRTT